MAPQAPEGLFYFLWPALSHEYTSWLWSYYSGERVRGRHKLKGPHCPYGKVGILIRIDLFTIKETDLSCCCTSL